MLVETNPAQIRQIVHSEHELLGWMMKTYGDRWGESAVDRLRERQLVVARVEEMLEAAPGDIEPILKSEYEDIASQMRQGRLSGHSKELSTMRDHQWEVARLALLVEAACSESLTIGRSSEHLSRKMVWW